MTFGLRHLAGNRKHGQAVLWVFLVILLLGAGGYVVLNNYVQAPYVVSEVYQEEEPYTLVTESVAQEPYVVLVPYNQSVTEQLTETVPVRRGFGDIQPRSYMYDGRSCELVDYDYSVTYFDGSENDLVYLSDIGFHGGTSTNAVRSYLSRFEWFATGTDIGYNERTNVFNVAALVCNKEKSALHAKFAVCQHWNGKRMGSCPDTLTRRFSPNQCVVIYLPWYTRDPVGKSLRLEPVGLSQKFVCELPRGRTVGATNYVPSELQFSVESAFREPGPVSGSGKADYETVYLKIDRMYFRPNYYHLFGQAAIEAGYQAPILTKSGTLAIPRKFKSFPPTDISRTDAVTESKRHFLRTYAITKYRNETRFRNVTTTQVVNATRMVDKTRDVTRYRSMWDDLLTRFELADFAAVPSSPSS